MIIAKALSRYGGACQGDHHEGPRISKGDPIFKVPSEGKTTPSGQGPGFWICETCVKDYDNA